MNRIVISLCEYFIRRPLMTILMMLAIFFYGAAIYRSLPVSDLPEVDLPILQVVMNIPDASPETIANTVVAPLEKQLATIAGVEKLSSVSHAGSAQINLQFKLHYPLETAMQAVQATMSANAHLLPANSPAPTIRQVNTAPPMMYLALQSDKLPLTTLSRFAETTLSQPIMAVKGVSQVNIYGTQKKVVRIQIDPNKLFDNGLGLDDVVNNVQRNNVDVSTGSVTSNKQAYSLHINGQLTDISAYRALPLAYVNNHLLRLQDVAVIEEGVEDNRAATWYQNKRAVILAVERQAGANTIAIAKQIKELLPQIQRQIPEAQLTLVYDHASSMRATVNSVQRVLSVAAGLVIFVLILFAGHLTASLIATVSVAVVIAGLFGGMHYLGVHLHTLSFLALILALIYVIDDVVTMLEQTMRCQVNDISPLKTALQSVRQRAKAVIVTGAICASVFIAILYLDDQLSSWLRDIGMTVSMAIVFSSVVTLIFMPTLVSLTTPNEWQTEQSFWQRWLTVRGHQITTAYSCSLRWLLKRHYFLFSVFTLLLVVTPIVWFGISKNHLLPDTTLLLRDPLAKLAGAPLQSAKNRYQLSLQAQDLPTLQKATALLTGGLTQLPGMQDLIVDLQENSTQMDVHLLRDKMTALGITVEQVEKTLGYAYGSKRIASLNSPAGQYEVLLGLLPDYQDNPALLSQLYVHTNGGSLVPLKALTETIAGKGLLAIHHLNQLPAATFSFNLQPGVKWDAVSFEKIMQGLPASVTVITDFSAPALSLSANAKILLLVVTMAMYMMMVWLYQSYIHPLTMAGSLLITSAGALLALMICRLPLDVYAALGIVLIAVINVKQTLALVESALTLHRQQQLTVSDAIYKACLARFRPLMMTALAVLVAMIPMIFTFKTSNAITRPFGIAIFGGLLASQCVNLYLMPVVFFYLESIASWLRTPVALETEEEIISV